STAPLGTAGTLDVTAGADVALAGTIDGRCTGSTLEGTGLSAAVTIDTGGDVVLTGLVDLTAPAPDGLAGSLRVNGAAVMLGGTVLVPGEGQDGCGGEVFVTASRAL